MLGNLNLEDCNIYSNGLVYCSVCVPKDWTHKQIERAVNALNSTGIESEWKISSDPTFYTGGPNPKQCEQDSERIHYLMEC